jgi:hypothetical protein
MQLSVTKAKTWKFLSRHHHSRQGGEKKQQH